MSVVINTSKHTGYRERTMENAMSVPVTIALAVNFDTAGEKLTRRCVEESGQKYIPVQLDAASITEWSAAHQAARTIIEGLKPFDDWTKISVNVAGNGMYSFPKEVSQENLDVFMTRVLLLVNTFSDVEINRVRSGGQTGIDEAGVKAADTLGLVAAVHGPQDFKFRIRMENRWLDIADRSKFEMRFSDEPRRRRHLEPLKLLSEQLLLFPREQRMMLLQGEPVQLASGALVEIAENDRGQDRLWYGDELFDVNLLVNDKAPEVKHDIYYRYQVEYSEYMSDCVKSREVFASDVDKAARVVESEQTTDLVFGSYPPDVMSVHADAVIVDGMLFNIDPEEVLSVSDMNAYCHYLLQSRTPDAINIWYSTGENADLSNFVVRPFDYRLTENDYIRFQSVEQGFQYMKTMPAYSACPDDVRSQLQQAILATTDGAKLRELGRSVPGLDSQLWTRNNEKIMYEMIWSSFDMNPAARERLIGTGDVNILHHQDRSVWRYAFPRLLKRARHDFLRRKLIRDNYNSMRLDVGKSSIGFYEGQIEPHKDVVFVFGSNYQGRHGAGAAKVAREKFGAEYGQAVGLQGNSYAIPTKDLTVKENNGFRSVSKEEIIDNIRAMYRSAEANFTKTYMVAYTNPPYKHTLNGYSGKEMIEMFIKAGPIPFNVQFSSVWKEEMSRQLKVGMNMKK